MKRDEKTDTQTLSDLLLRTAARSGKSFAKGTAAWGDLAALPINAGLGLFGGQQIQPPSEAIGNLFDQYTNGYSVPQNFTERASDTAAEWISPGFLPKAAIKGGAKLAPVLQAMTPQNLKELYGVTTAGGSFQAAQEAFPDNPLIQFAASLGGGMIPGAATKAGKALQTLKNIGSEIPLPGNYARNKHKGFDLNEGVASKEAAERLGIHLRPAEATGNPFIAAVEGQSATTPKAADAMYKHGQERESQIAKAIEGLYEDIHPSIKGMVEETKAAKNAPKEASLPPLQRMLQSMFGIGPKVVQETPKPYKYNNKLSPDENARGAAQNIIEKEHYELSQKAKPFYEKASKDRISKKAFASLVNEDPNIVEAMKSVAKDPVYGKHLLFSTGQGIKFLHLVKTHIDTLIKKAATQGDNTRVAFLRDSQNNLINTMDKASPAYKKARGIFSEGSKPIEKIENSAVGKVARRDDITTKNIGKDLFDLHETNPARFKQQRDLIQKESPETWNSLVRQELERRVGSSNKGGTNFYNKILKDDKSYRQMHDALEGIPKAQNKLADMRLALKNLIEPVSTKQAAARAKNGTKLSETVAGAVKTAANYVSRGVYDKAMVDLLLNPQWDKELARVSKITNPVRKNEEYSKLLKIANQSITNKGAEVRDEKNQISEEELDRLLSGSNPSDNASKAPVPIISEEELDKLLLQ